MAATIVIRCPECKRQNKGPAELQGKKVRCKACGHTFMVKAPDRSKSGSPAKTASKKAPAPAVEQQDDEDGGKNPYQLTDVVLVPRCPQCAHEMESADAIVCLNCGYNTQTRIRMKTVKTYAHTPFDWILWLAPGVLCVLGLLVALGIIVFLWIPAGLPAIHAQNKDAWWSCEKPLFNWEQVWGTVPTAFAGWAAGVFAFKRLVLHPRPPEKYKRGGEA